MNKRRRLFFLICLIVICIASLIVWRKLRDLRPPAEQIADFLIDTTGQAIVDVELFDSDLLKSHRIVGFIEHKSNKIGIATFRNVNDPSVRLVKCSFSERLLKRAADIYIYYYHYTVEDDKSERFLLVLNNNPELVKILINHYSINEIVTIEVHNIPSVILIPIPNFQSEFSYTFYDAQDNEIR
ncbi:MAG: hypothetical protein LBK75_01530 [Oscillospiraceae bacterium]|nr:hypothetical protein [Oscillospiraceae bacterium]